MLQVLPLAKRFAQNGAESKLLWNAAMFSSRSTPAAGQSQEVAAAEMKVVRQYSASEAAALANKKKHLIGLGGGPSLGASSRAPLSTFASKAFSTSCPASAAAAAAAEEPVKKSFFGRMATAAAALAGAIAVAMAAPSVALADSPTAWQWGFQDTATSTGQAAQDLHHDIMFFLITITVLVLYLTFQFATKFHYSHVGPMSEKLTHHTTLEVLWTIIPTFIVLSIAIPSLTLIYSMDQHNDRPGLTVKVIGRQWYWSYEMHDHLQHKLVDPDRLVAIAEKSITA